MTSITIIARVIPVCDVHQHARGSFVQLSFSVDAGHVYDKVTIYFDVNDNRTQIAPYLTKGTQVAVDGELKTREYNGKTYLSVRPTELKLLGGKRDTQRDHQASSTQLEDEIPF